MKYFAFKIEIYFFNCFSSYVIYMCEIGMLIIIVTDQYVDICSYINVIKSANSLYFSFLHYNIYFTVFFYWHDYAYEAQ